jgi:hypothetical protein
VASRWATSRLLHELPPALAGGFDLRNRLEPKLKKFPLLTALAKALRNKSDFIFRLKPTAAQTNLRLKPEAIHKTKESTEAVLRKSAFFIKLSWAS